MDFFVGQKLRCIADYHAHANGYPVIGDIYIVVRLRPSGYTTVGVRRVRDGWEGNLNKDRFEPLPYNQGDD